MNNVATFPVKNGNPGISLFPNVRHGLEVQHGFDGQHVDVLQPRHDASDRLFLVSKSSSDNIDLSILEVIVTFGDFQKFDEFFLVVHGTYFQKEESSQDQISRLKQNDLVRNVVRHGKKVYLIFVAIYNKSFDTAKKAKKVSSKLFLKVGMYHYLIFYQKIVVVIRHKGNNIGSVGILT